MRLLRIGAGNATTSARTGFGVVPVPRRFQSSRLGSIVRGRNDSTSARKDRLSIVPTLAVVTALGFPSPLAAGQVAPMSCGVSARETRWLAESYAETHTYGLSGEEEWIGSYGGLAASGDSLFLYDQLRPRIVHLSGNLEERNAFGRQGQGPGEFNALPLPWLDDVSEGHVAFDGRQLVVYDRPHAQPR